MESVTKGAALSSLKNKMQALRDDMDAVKDELDKKAKECESLREDKHQVYVDFIASSPLWSSHLARIVVLQLSGFCLATMLWLADL